MSRRRLLAALVAMTAILSSGIVAAGPASAIRPGGDAEPRDLIMATRAAGLTTSEVRQITGIDRSASLRWTGLTDDGGVRHYTVLAPEGMTEIGIVLQSYPTRAAARAMVEAMREGMPTDPTAKTRTTQDGITTFVVGDSVNAFAGGPRIAVQAVCETRTCAIRLARRQMEMWLEVGAPTGPVALSGVSIVPSEELLADALLRKGSIRSALGLPDDSVITKIGEGDSNYLADTTSRNFEISSPAIAVEVSILQFGSPELTRISFPRLIHVFTLTGGAERRQPLDPRTTILAMKTGDTVNAVMAFLPRDNYVATASCRDNGGNPGFAELRECATRLVVRQARKADTSFA